MTRRARPLPFTQFCARVLKVQLTRGQRVLCAVAFDGVDPCQLEGDDRELARTIFGDVETIPREARAVLAAFAGARAGKSYVLGALRLLHLALTVALDLAPGEEAFGIIVEPDLRLARQTLRYVQGAAQSAPDIRRLIQGSTENSLTLKRPDGNVVTIEALPATRGGSAVRGRSLVGAVLDEAAFFRDDDYAVNDVEIFKACAPRVVLGGQVVIASTPWAELGLLFDLYQTNHGKPVTALAAHAATTTLRDDEHTLALVARERERDPDNAAREFDAIPMPAGSGSFFDPAAIAQCIVPDSPLVLPGAGGCLGLDTGFRKDPSAGVVVRSKSDLFEVAEAIEIRPPAGGRLVPSETIGQLIARGKHHRCTRLVADQHYVESIREHASAANLALREAPGGLQGKAKVYTAARTLIHEGRVRIGACHKRLLSQLREVVSRPTSGGQITITSPRRGGAHGDLASAFVLALWACERTSRDDGPIATILPSNR